MVPQRTKNHHTTGSAVPPGVAQIPATMNPPADNISIIHLPLVLVLNRAWQAINVRAVGLAVQQVMAGSATALDVGLDSGVMRPVRWAEWLTLPVRPGDRALGTVRGPVRAPTVIVCARYDKVPLRRPPFSARAVRLRDGNRCQYTGRLLGAGEGSLDHVLPRSRGGANTFENVVWSDRRVNNRKANRTPEEAGLRLRSTPGTPRAVPVTLSIRNPHHVADWRPFVADPEKARRSGASNRADL